MLHCCLRSPVVRSVSLAVSRRETAPTVFGVQECNAISLQAEPAPSGSAAACTLAVRLKVEPKLTTGSAQERKTAERLARQLPSARVERTEAVHVFGSQAE
eukprot:TRINITY_DN20909_c1_g1_i1.p3 TRINITY_DN20909_c1_g1~~TRINITY_DN20909_c1_g1_i1.p3  ORF type:complete len:101 (+),score=12.80 TRINITY_DN20909_c1_g1_i1:71-373(+)